MIVYIIRSQTGKESWNGFYFFSFSRPTLFLYVGGMWYIHTYIIISMLMIFVDIFSYGFDI